MLAVDLVLALTNGYLTTVVMIRAAEGLPPVEQEVCARCVLWGAHTPHCAQIVTNASVLAMISGLAAGSFLSFLWLL